MIRGWVKSRHGGFVLRCGGWKQGANRRDAMHKIHVIGLGLSREDLTPKHLKLIESADLLVGGRRHLDYFSQNDVRKLAITRDIASMIREIKACMSTDKVVVLASGDPLFYGIGTTLVKALGRDRLVIHPNVSSPAAAFAAICEPWEDARLISFHGRVPEDFNRMVQCEHKIAVLTDGTHTPGWIAKYLISHGRNDFSAHVFECMGSDEEKIHCFDSVAQLLDDAFAMPNIMLLKRKILPQAGGDLHETSPARGTVGAGQGRDVPCGTSVAPIYPGMPDDRFYHEKGLITKAEVRSVVVSKLKLDADFYTFWDLGAGSGSVSIEVSRFLQQGQLFAVEKNGNRIPLIERNVEKFGVSNLTVCHGDLPEAMVDLPAPDRIFVGGGGKNIAQIIELAGKRLSPHGIMVVNTVLIQTMYVAVETLKMLGFKTQFIQLQVAASRPMPFGERLEALNPVWIITGEKRKENQ